VKASFAAPPTLIANELLVALVRPDDDAVSVYVPALSIAQPTNVAMPEEAAFGLAVQVSVAPLGVVIANDTEAELDATVLPFASWIVTTG
jgi:hypothetical protein